jgi:hypothetical protein
MPLVLDVLAGLRDQSFATAEVQEALAATHGIAMPQDTVATLLKRATRKGCLKRESGRYRVHPHYAPPPSGIAGEKGQIESGHQRLAEALLSHAQRRGLAIETAEAGLDLLFAFLEEEQVALLLGTPPGATDRAGASPRERTIVAEFLHDSIRDDPALTSVLRGLLEGLVLYHAAFLPDLAAANRSFKDLRVLFDSGLVRQALGYEGVAMRTLVRETIDLLKGSTVQCLVLDKTVHEIQRILAMYEGKVGSAQGRQSLRPGPMARHFLTQRYSPSDVREMSALLEIEIAAAGFTIQEAPRHVNEYTAGEEALAKRLADPVTKDEHEPRVLHDVDCVAAAVTMRRGHRSSTIDEVRVSLYPS